MSDDSTKTYTKEQILNDPTLQQEILHLAATPHDTEDGGLYVPARHFPPELASRARDMMEVVGADNVLVLTDMAFAVLDWALHERLAGKQIGAVDTDDEFLETAVPFLRALDPTLFERIP